MKILIIFCVVTLLNAIPIDDSSNAEYGTEFQGDIKLTPEQENEVNSEGRNGRTGIINSRQRWPKISGKVTVPYVIDGFTTAQRNQIYAGMNDISSKTCVKFVQRTSQADYIRIHSGSGCWSYVGRIGGKQDLSYQSNGCLSHGTIMHELIHALGYGHMHQHYDRDSLVRINWENIQSGTESNFNKMSTKDWYNFGTPYDLTSVMHYGGTAFSKNGRLTIQAYNTANQNQIGQRSRLSDGDVQRIKTMYEC